MLHLFRRRPSAAPSFSLSAPFSAILRKRLRGICCSSLMLVTMLIVSAAHGVTIFSFSPNSGPVGTTVTINGSGYSAAAGTYVKFNGTRAKTLATVVTPNTLTVVVPGSATTGQFVVSVGYSPGATSPSPFTVTSGPSIANFSPTSGVVGDTVTINGTGFGATPAANSVTFNGTPAPVASNSTSTALHVTVPANATTGPITVTVNGKTTTSGSNFTVSCPSAVQVTTTAIRQTYSSAGIGAAENVYMADAGTVLKVAPDGTSSVLAGGASSFTDGTGSAAGFGMPDGFAVDSAGNVFVTDESTIRKITSAGAVTTVAGSHGVAGSEDGTGNAARFNNPVFLAVDVTGNLYVSDAGNHTVRKITPGGAVTTMAGTPGVSGSTNGVGSAAHFSELRGIAVDRNGNVFVVDGNAIRKISPSGVVSTLAGDTTSAGSVDGIGAGARFFSPVQIAIDSLGTLYVADGYSTVREVTAAGVTSTVAGVAHQMGHSDGIGSAARFAMISGIAVSSTGQIYVSEGEGDNLRLLTTIANCPAPTCTSVGPKNATISSSSTTARFFAYGVQNATVVYFPTWWIDGGNQNDIQWLAGTDEGNGTWHVDVPLAQYDTGNPRYGNYATHVYMANPDYQSGAPIFCDYTQWVRLTPQPPQPVMSVSVPATSSSTTVSVTWAPSTSGDAATYFQLQRATSAIGPWSPVNLNIPAPATSYSDTSVPGNGTYYYEVAACNLQGCSAYTVSSAVVVNLPPPPNPPVSVTVPTSVNSASVPVSWIADSSGSAATYYGLWRGPSASGPWELLKADITTTSYSDTVPAAGIYYYEVKACNGQGCSDSTVSGNGVNVTGSGGVTLPPLPSPVTDTIPLHDAGTGTMAGEAGVSGGAATYHVPIIVPPGRAGMQPSLSLDYNSRSGNGVMGMGWTISGLSSIHRCPQTLEQDGNAAGVSYTSNDRLCLDGQRLVAVSGSYGVAGTVYATEVDSHARITQIGGGLTGTATCFKVEQKDGRVLHYGAVVSGSSCGASSAKARVQPNGAPATLSWLVEKIEDHVGNNQTLAYTDYGNGEVLLSTVKYTGFNGAVGNRTITFAYQPRTNVSGVTDVSSSYLAGGLTMQTRALTSITTAVAGTTVRTYTPTYVAAQYSGRLLMAKLQECAYSSAGSACHPETKFSYNDAALDAAGNVSVKSLQGFGFAPNQNSLNVPYRFTVIGDLDGDGTKETLVTVNQFDGNHVYLAQMTADRQIHVGTDITNFGYDALPGLSSDIDGSGRAAMVKLPTSGTANIAFGIWSGARGDIASGNPFQAVASTIPFDASLVRLGQNQSVYAADLNNDGKTDLLVVEADSTCGSNDAEGPQLGLFYYRNTTSGQLGPGNTMTHFVKQAAHLFCLARTTVHHVGGSDSWYAPSIEHVADFDGDGLPDIYMIYSDSNRLVAGAFAGIQRTLVRNANTSSEIVSSALSSADSVLTCDTSSVISTTDECNWQNGYFAHWIDVNGDGLEDFVVARPYNWKWEPDPNYPNDPTKQIKVDLPLQWEVRLNKGGTLAPAVAVSALDYVGLDAYPTKTASSVLTGSGYLFRYLNRLPIMDVDADGKPDILIPQNNNNESPTDVHGFALKVCIAQVRTLTLPSGDFCPVGSTTAAASAATPNLTPSPQQCVIYICPNDPGGGVNLPDNADYVPPSSGDSGEKTAKHVWNGLPAYSAYGFGPNNSPPDGGDNSVYHLAALKFTQDWTGAFAASVVDTPLVSRLSDGFGRSEDLFGDGLTDLTTAVGCPDVPVTGKQGTFAHCSVIGTFAGTKYGPTTFPDGTDGTDNSIFASTWALYGSINQGVHQLGGSLAMRRASMGSMTVKASTNGISLGLSTPILPGLLFESVNGVGDTALWNYVPLSTPESQDGVPLYTIDSGYVDSRHYLFESSMPVVDGMAQSPGNEPLDPYYTGFRSTVYGYGNAMYNHLGRGFTGFQTIVAETGDGTDTSGQHYRATRTTTTFHQKFPLIGKVANVLTQARDVKANAMTTVGDETDSYVCSSNRGACPDDAAIAPNSTTGGTVFAPVLDSQTVKTYDFNSGAQYAQVDTVNANGGTSGWDAYGNLTYQAVTRADKGAAAFVSSQVTTTASEYYAPDIANWWVNKLKSSTVTASIAYASTHALPAGAGPSTQTLATSYTWNPDRTPLTKTMQAGIANQQSTTTYCYPGSASPCPVVSGSSYGLPSSVSVNAPDLGSALSPTRTTSYTYTNNGTSASADGYFLLTAQNALNQTITTSHAPSDGQVLTATDPNGVQVVTTYDAFGRATQIRHLDRNGTSVEAPMQIAYTSCANGWCLGGFAEDGNEVNAAYRITTVQAGSPTRVGWYDLLGREIKTAERGYDGRFVETLTQYDVMGTLFAKSAPFFAGAAMYDTTYDYDALGRVTNKSAPNACGGNMTTLYDYSGRQTTITARGTCTGGSPNTAWISMTRSKNVLGQYMQTVDAKNGVTDFWTEPLGHVVAMKDAEGNVTTAQYNALGQRTQSSDPDQGTWTFTYDALGELLKQTDARGTVSTVTSRDALGRTLQQQSLPPSPLPPGTANEIVQDTWSYDPANGIGALGNALRRRGTSKIPGSNPAVWSATYFYDTAARPSAISTAINDGGSVTLNSSMGFDSFGRPSTHTYPDGLVVQTLYGPYGQSGGIANFTTGKIWYETTAQDAWGKPTTEKYSDGTVGTSVDYASTGQRKTMSWTLGGNTLDSVTYGYDGFGNLASSKRTAGASINTETYGYDVLQRLTSASRTGGALTYGYSASGNLTSKSDVGSYSYGSNGCGPHAAYAAGGNTYSCDANGNVVGGNTLSIVYDAANHPRTASRGGAGSTTWAYDANEAMTVEASSRGTRYFGPGGYEQVGAQGIHELGPIVISRNGGVDTMTTTLRDRLGSTIDAIEAGFASSANARDYDAFGAVRNGDMGNRPGGTLNLSDTIHGFTRHEHADDVRLIHMGGRIYDYTLGRFLSVDPIIGNPLSSQSLNPYSYIGNNPLSGTDPTGYNAEDHCMGDAFCQALSDSEFLGGEVGRLRSSLTYGGAPANKRQATNGNDSTSDIYGNKKSDKVLPSVTVGAVESCQVPMRCASGEAAAHSDSDQRYYQLPHSSLDPRDDPMFQLVGQDLAALAAYAVAKVTGNEALTNTVADDMAQKTSANWSLAGGLFLMGRGGKGAPELNIVAEPTTITNSVGRAYPNVLNPGTGEPIAYPGGGLTRTPMSERVPWGAQERGTFIREWYERGFSTPKGGWAGYDIHHIVPREYGGSNAFDNLVPVERGVHQNEFNTWWRDYQ